MGIVAKDTILDLIFELSSNEAKSISTGWISDEPKMMSLAKSDGREIGDVYRDVVTGMVGERTSYHYIQHHKVPCQAPDFGVLERNEAIWGKDLIALRNVRILTANKKLQIVDRSISVKNQFLSQTNKFNDSEPSWIFQLPCIGKNGLPRYGDPLLKDGSLNKLLVVVWTNNYWNGDPVCCSKFRRLYEQGFRWTSQVACFWWPDVFPYLGEMHRKDLRSQKKALYYKDIKHLRVSIIGTNNDN